METKKELINVYWANEMKLPFGVPSPLTSAYLITRFALLLRLSLASPFGKTTAAEGSRIF
jgi:hypothetical protein